MDHKTASDPRPENLNTPTNDSHHRRQAWPEKENAMLFGEPETAHFLTAIQRLKRILRRKERMTRQAKQKVRATLRKLASH